jgi:hypothetical protein
MTLAWTKAKVDKTLTVQASLTIITLDRQNITIVQATDGTHIYWLYLAIFSAGLELFCKYGEISWY